MFARAASLACLVLGTVGLLVQASSEAALLLQSRTVPMATAREQPPGPESIAGTLDAWRPLQLEPGAFIAHNVAHLTSAPQSPAKGESRPALTAPRILLNPKKLEALRQKAAAKAPEWLAFKDRLDRGLTRVLNSSQYQASSLQWIADYALGYQVLKESDPATAADYADKAIAMIKSGLRDYQQGWAPRQYLTQGNGNTKNFALPNEDVIPSSVRVYVGPITTQKIQRSGKQSDTIAWYSHILKVSDKADGEGAYREGVDWRRNPKLKNNQLEWLPSGRQPDKGSTYYVLSASPPAAKSAKFKLSGNTIVLNAAPDGNQAVFVEYVYGTRSGKKGNLAYQQTGAGQGGFTSIYMDSNYTSRSLGKYMAIGYDWLQDYAGLDPAMKTDIARLLVEWNDYLRDKGFRTNGPANNYGAGTYVSRMLTAVALSGGRDSNGDRLVEEMREFRQKRILPLLQSPVQSHKGGYWSEGWGYGNLATRNLLLAAIAFEEAGLGEIRAERAWASEVTRHFISAQPSPSTLYDGGDGGYPRKLPGNDLFVLIAELDSDATTRAYANRIIQSREEKDPASFVGLLYRNLEAPAAFWSSEPLHHRAEGTGLHVARADWTYDSTWLAFQFGNLVSAFAPGAPGHLQLQRGSDNLLVNAPSYGNDYAAARKSRYSNLVLIDDNGDGAQNYRFSMGVWFGRPGVVTTAYEAVDRYLYVGGDYHAAYSKNSKPGAGGPASKLTRQVVYLRPDYVVVFDWVATTKDTYLKQLQWHFLNKPELSGDSWVESVGKSKLFGQTFSSQELTTTAQEVKVGSKKVFQVATRNAKPTRSVRYLTALQSASASTSSMVTTTSIASADGRMEGLQMGSKLVLFGKDGAVNPAKPIAYSAAGKEAEQVEHLIVDLQPGREYQLVIDGTGARKVKASPQGTLTFTTPAKAKVELS